MEELGNLINGFSVALTGPNLVFMLVGITLGGNRPTVDGMEPRTHQRSQVRSKVSGAPVDQFRKGLGLIGLNIDEKECR